MKRFTETTKWRDPWFRRLSPLAKLLWINLCDSCDHAGVIDVDLEAASFEIGKPVDETHLAELQTRLHKLENGKTVIVSFVPFQYGELSEACRPHQSIIATLNRHGFNPADLKKNTLSEGYPNPTCRVQEKEKEKEQDKKGSQEGKSKRRTDLETLKLFCAKAGISMPDAEWVFHKWEGNGWTNNGKPINSWSSTLTSWKLAGHFPSQKARAFPGQQPQAPPTPQKSVKFRDRWDRQHPPQRSEFKDADPAIAQTNYEDHLRYWKAHFNIP